MIAVPMLKEYLDDILAGRRNTDARLYPPKRMGIIALSESGKNEICGYAEVTSYEIIRYEDYCMWHVGKSYTRENAIEDIRHNLYVCRHKEAYLWHLDGITKLPKTLLIGNPRKDGPYISYNEDELIESYKKNTLFEI